MDLPKGTEENPKVVLLHEQEIVLHTDHAAKQKEVGITEVNHSRVRRPASHCSPIAEGQVGPIYFITSLQLFDCLGHVLI